jgi:glycosyltransferase involved in cell wall biosynthesis
MRIALLGTRGIPASYGGFETFAEELSVRLVERGHEVTVYCRAHHAEPRYRGVRLPRYPRGWPPARCP